ncbi:MAG: hypothetical protein IJU66_08800 [Oscillospiraceae bacterium]|nr:hypothetical protein [Oscillospiraceae bacterium]
MSVIESPSACIAAEEASIAKVVLFPGDPLRAKTVAETYLMSTEQQPIFLAALTS